METPAASQPRGSLPSEAFSPLFPPVEGGQWTLVRAIFSMKFHTKPLNKNSPWTSGKIRGPFELQTQAERAAHPHLRPRNTPPPAKVSSGLPWVLATAWWGEKEERGAARGQRGQDGRGVLSHCCLHSSSFPGKPSSSHAADEEAGRQEFK